MSVGSLLISLGTKAEKALSPMGDELKRGEKIIVIELDGKVGEREFSLL